MFYHMQLRSPKIHLPGQTPCEIFRASKIAEDILSGISILCKIPLVDILNISILLGSKGFYTFTFKIYIVRLASITSPFLMN